MSGLSGGVTGLTGHQFGDYFLAFDDLYLFARRQLRLDVLEVITQIPDCSAPHVKHFSIAKRARLDGQRVPLL